MVALIAAASLSPVVCAMSLVFLSPAFYRTTKGTSEGRGSSMAASSRRKGLAGEAEVAAIWRRAGFEVRGLEGQGDHLVSLGNGRLVHSEVKRQERLQLWGWLAQAEAEAPLTAVPVVAFRRSRGKWYAALPLADLIALVTE